MNNSPFDLDPETGFDRAQNADPLGSSAATGYGAWQTIETAPKDRRIIIFDGIDMFVAAWDDDENGWIYACVATDWNYYSEVDGATHWMPLPEPPNDLIRRKRMTETVICKKCEREMMHCGCNAASGSFSPEFTGCATIACHVCKTEARPKIFGDIPEGWGFVEDEDRDAPGGRGFWYACAECKER